MSSFTCDCFSAGWVDCWHTSYVSVMVTYLYHPMPILQSLYDHYLTLDGVATPELEESILSPLRPDVPGTSKAEVTAMNFDPNEWEPDHISVELEVAPSVLCLYGSLLRNLIHVKVKRDVKGITGFDGVSGKQTLSSNFCLYG